MCYDDFKNINRTEYIYGTILVALKTESIQFYYLLEMISIVFKFFTNKTGK